MDTDLERLETHRVKLTVRASREETRPILDVAYRHLAGSVNLPGFRKGKAPRQVIQAQLGAEAVLREFLEHALPELYARAIREHELAPISDPEFDDLDVSDLEGTGFSFTATVETRPRLEFQEADYKGIPLERPSVEVSDGEVDEQLDRLRERFAELDAVGHPARRGDFVMADLRASVHGEEIPEASGQDLLYEVGSEALVPELDKELEGSRAGDILKANATLPERFGERGGQEVSFQILVKEVKSKRLPPLDDDFAKTASEFDTLEELREDVRTKLGRLREAQADAAIRDQALQALVDRVDVELPDRLIDTETESRIRAARERAERQGVTLDQVLEASNVDELQFRSDARAHAIRAVQADLALEAVARAEGLEVGKEDLDRAVEALAESIGRGAKDVRRSLESSGQITSLAGDIIRDKALDVVVENATVTEEGRSASREGNG
jgi:trigger factor